MTHKRMLVIAAVLAALGVALGAFGAHALEDYLSPERMATWETAVQYHMWHSLAIMVLAIVSEAFKINLKISIRLILAGILIFSGSLYLLCLTGIGWLGAITPIGGICFITGWLYCAVQIIKNSDQ